MVIHGDMDPLPMSNVENFFAALVLQRRQARFVRYWGEGHGFAKAANWRDAFQRMFAWFDDYGDIAREPDGHMVFDGDCVRSRGGQMVLRPEDFAKFEFVGRAEGVTRSSKP
jgi:hypothetical protein